MHMIACFPFLSVMIAAVIVALLVIYTPPTPVFVQEENQIIAIILVKR